MQTYYCIHNTYIYVPLFVPSFFLILNDSYPTAPWITTHTVTENQVTLAPL